VATPERPIALVDIDGVVADVRHRLHHLEGRRKDWDAFFAGAADDPPHAEGLAIVETLAVEHDIVYLTGRPERLRAVTERWLAAHAVAGPVTMRGSRDRRPAAVVKVEEAKRIARTRTVALVVDDDERVLAAMRDAGFATFPAQWEFRSPALEEAQDVDGRT
jgi:hypothetical protein